MINTISATINEIWEQSAKILSGKLEEAGRADKKVLVLLSGGSAISIFQWLCDYFPNLAIRADNIAFGQIDERFQPVDQSEINSYAIEKSGLTELLTSKNIPFYKIPQTGTFREAAFNYDKLLTKLFGNFDYKIAVLGIGRDGHTAGLLRGYKREWDKDMMVTGYENRGEFKYRITITPKVFRMLDYGLITVSGIDKKEMVERILN